MAIPEPFSTITSTILLNTLVGSFEANPSAGRISNESPVGKALLGHKVGDTVIVSTPGGVKEYTILSIE